MRTTLVVLILLLVGMAAENNRLRNVIAEVSAQQAETSMLLTKAKIQLAASKDLVHELRTGRID